MKNQLSTTQIAIGVGILLGLILRIGFQMDLFVAAYFSVLAGATVAFVLSFGKPKYERKMFNSFFGLWVALGVIGGGYLFLVSNKEDLGDFGSADTAGQIAAIQIHDEGQQVVIFDKLGKKSLSPNYTAGKTDRDIAWRPDGNRLFFVSDRGQPAFNVFRWNLSTNDVNQRGISTLSRFDLSFRQILNPEDKSFVDAANQTVLLSQGGFILELDAKKGTTQQILPPKGGVTVGSEEGSGSSGQLDALYQKLGTSFRSARWLHGDDFLAVVMKRDEGEILFVQKNPARATQEDTPRVLAAGEKISMDVDPKNGILVFTVLDFKFPDPENIPEGNIKDGKVIRPFKHGIFAYDTTKEGNEALVRIGISNDDKVAFGAPAVSPDGTQVVIPGGHYDGTSFTPQALGIMAVQPDGGSVGSRIAAGPIYEPAWSPDGRSLTYIKRDGGHRSIFTIDKDGANEKKVSDDGDYMTPKFSPQIKQ